MAASVQFEKPSDQTSNQIQHTTFHQKTTISDKNQTTNTHEHSFSDKVKDMAHSARKLFNHHEHHALDHHTQKPSNCSCGGKTETKKKKKKKKKTIVKNTQGQDGHCMPKMLDRVKNLKTKKSKEEKCSESSSDSDNEIIKNKN